MPTTTYKRAIAAALLTLAVSVPIGACGTTPGKGAPTSTIGTDGDRYSRVCRTQYEDSAIPSSCKLDPSARYTYNHGAWRAVPSSFTYANGNQPPTGKELQP